MAIEALLVWIQSRASQGVLEDTLQYSLWDVAVTSDNEVQFILSM